MRSFDYAAARATAERAVEAAGAALLRERARGFATQWKSDRSPVTSADLAAEEAILAVLASEWPGCSVLAEESGATPGDPRAVWIVDPLDGTRGFARGGEHFGPLVALELEGRVIAGAMGLPMRNLVYSAAHGLGCTRNAAPIRLRTATAWSDATLSVGEWSRLLRTRYATAAIDLACTCASVRAYGDPASLAMVLDGVADLWIEAGVQPWDLAPAQVLITEAGGVYTDFAGLETVRSSDALAGAPELHRHALQRLIVGL